jgi:hypothetical protein
MVMNFNLNAKNSVVGVTSLVAFALWTNGAMNTRQNLDELDENGHETRGIVESIAKGFFPDNWNDVVGLWNKGDDGNETPQGSVELPTVGSEQAIALGNVIVNFAFGE